MYQRLCKPLSSKSFFLFGARGTGKSSLLRAELESKCALWINLLESRQFIKYSRNPSLLKAEIAELLVSKEIETRNVVVVDEVQKVPALLDEIHAILETPQFSQKISFALSGSSARKLKKGGANLLAGRALLNNLYPLTFLELGEDFKLDQVLNWGSLPAVYCEQDKLTREEILYTYVAMYLKEEIREEQIVRNLDPFNRFLEVAAQCNGSIINYSNVGRDSGVDYRAVTRYYEILEDTLLGHFLPGYHRSVRKQQRQSPKFYFFDLGVVRALANSLSSPLLQGNYGYGRVFEQFFILEVIRLNAYYRARYKLSYLVTKDGAEIDLIVERSDSTILIEIKSGTEPNIHDARHLLGLKESFATAELWVVSQGAVARVEEGVRFLPWGAAIKEIFNVV